MKVLVGGPLGPYFEIFSSLAINLTPKVISHNPPIISKYMLHSIPNNSNKNPRKSNEYPIIPDIANQLATILFLYRTKHIGMLPIPKESIAIWYPKSYDIFVFSIKFNNILDNAISSIIL